MVQILEGNRQIYQNKCRSLPPILYLWKPLHMLQRLQRHPTLLKGPVLSIFVSVIKQFARINLIRICDQLLLKVLTNEKRGGLAMVSFDRFSFKVFSLLFSNKSMQAPSCERTKTTQRTLFLSFATNNCFLTSGEKLLVVFE